MFGHCPSVAPKADAAETMCHLNLLSSPWLSTEASMPAPAPMAVSTGVSALGWSMPTPTPVPAPAPVPAMHASVPSGPSNWGVAEFACHGLHCVPMVADFDKAETHRIFPYMMELYLGLLDLLIEAVKVVYKHGDCSQPGASTFLHALGHSVQAVESSWDLLCQCLQPSSWLSSLCTMSILNRNSHGLRCLILSLIQS